MDFPGERELIDSWKPTVIDGRERGMTSDE